MERFLGVWLDFKGRIDRRTWLGFIVILALSVVAVEFLIRRAFHLPGVVPAADGPFLAAFTGDGVSLLAELIFLWPSLALDVKRWHDLGRSGWNVLIAYGPVAALIALEAAGAGGTDSHPDRAVQALLSISAGVLLVYFILMCARKGQPRPNRFGPAPG
jgi:uncharacterized membrane protein YhaH (DUF805 family)